MCFLASEEQDTKIRNKPHFFGTKFQTVAQKCGEALTKITVAPNPNYCELET
jgi:hypothetical protein